MCKPRPCRFCRQWFRPDVRVGRRQKACSKPDCQKRRRAATQGAWRRRNPEYGVAYRIEQKRAAKRPEPPQPRAPLDQLPWDIAQDEFKPAGAGFLAALGRVLVIHAKDQIGSQVRARAEESRKQIPATAKDQMSP